MIRHMLLAVVMALVAVHTAKGQSLADVATKEEARRKTVNTPGRVYTNKDLPETVESSPAPAPAPAPLSDVTAFKPQTDAASKETGKADAKEPAIDEKEWRKLARDYRLRFNELRGHVAAVESRLETLRADQQTPAVASEIKLTDKSLAKFRRNLELVEKDWARIEEEARKAGASALLQE